MTLLGSSAKPTYGQIWFGSLAVNKIAFALTLPAGLWDITTVGIWAAGKDATPTTYICLWDGGGNLLANSSSFSMASRSFGLGQSDNYERACAYTTVVSGQTVYAGFARTHSGTAHQYGHNNGGQDHYQYSNGTVPGTFNYGTTNTNSVGVYLYYESSNSVPNAPTLNDPTAGEFVASQTPTLNFTPSDPDGDTHIYYEYQVDNNSDFSSPVEYLQVGPGSFPNGVAINDTVDATLVRGTTYYWRARTHDGTGWGAWSAGTSFVVASLPTATLTNPASAQTAKLYFTAGSNTTPKIRAEWTYNCPDGHAQNQAIIKIYADSAGSPGSLLNTDTYNGSNAFFDTTYAVTESTYYHVSVQPRCSLNVQGVESTKHRCRTRWARASYYFDSGSTPVTLAAVTDTTVSGNQALVIEYAATSSSSEPAGSAWKSTVSAAGLNQFFWHRMTAFAWGSSPTSPKLNSLQWNYSATGTVLDQWTVASGGTVDVGTYVYGTQSLKHATSGSEQKSYQTFTVVPDTQIILSGRIKTQGTPAAELRIEDVSGTTTLASVTATSDTDWTRYKTNPISTGSATQLRMVCRTSAAGGSTAWFDAIKVEASTVVTPWTPGFIGPAVALDAGGLSISALAGGVFRLKGSDAGGKATVELGATGLDFTSDTNFDPLIRAFKTGEAQPRLILDNFGSIIWGPGGSTAPDAQIFSGADQELTFADGGFGDLTRIDFQGTPIQWGGASFPPSPSTNDLFYRTDRDTLYIWDGTRWLSEQKHAEVGSIFYPGLTSFTATNGPFHTATIPDLGSNSDIWLEKVKVGIYVDPAGTNLDASNKWVGTFQKRLANNTNTTIATINVDSAPEEWSNRTATINALLNNGTTHYMFSWLWTKTGTPGAMFFAADLTYRMVGE